MLAVGVGRWPHSTSSGYDWKPLLLAVLAVLLLRFLVRLEIGWPVAAAAIGVGTVWAMMIDWWGILPPTASVLLFVLLASSVADRIRQRPT
jgi:hypothetical protein